MESKRISFPDHVTLEERPLRFVFSKKKKNLVLPTPIQKASSFFFFISSHLSFLEVLQKYVKQKAAATGDESSNFSRLFLFLPLVFPFFFFLLTSSLLRLSYMLFVRSSQLPYNALGALCAPFSHP